MTDSPATTPDFTGSTGDRTLFVYGILRDRETVGSILGRPYMAPMWDAILSDYIAVRDMGPAYIFPEPGEVVDGMLLTGLEPGDFIALDIIEGTERRHYDRVPCTVLVGDGTPIETEVYRAGPHIQRRYAARLRNGRDPWADWGRRAYTADDDLNTDVLEAQGWTVSDAPDEPGTLRPDDLADAALLARWETLRGEYATHATANATVPLLSAPATEPRPPRPVYPGTPEHLPERIGIPLATEKRGRQPHGATLRLFVCDSLRSLDRLELVLDREWFGSRKAARLRGMRLTQSFPPMLVRDETEGAGVDGHLLSGLAAEDFVALDRAMQVGAGYQRRIEIPLGKQAAFVYVMGDKGSELLRTASGKRALAKRARKAADTARAADKVRAANKAGTAKKSRSLPSDTTLSQGAGLAAERYPDWYGGTKASARGAVPSRNGKALVSWKPNT